jgi:hypothetical protein
MFYTYDRRAAVAYARKYALSPNPDYHKFDNDCTNFISQCLFEGGWPMITGWYASDDVWWYTGGLFGWRAASHTWAGAQKLYNFLTKSERGKIVPGPGDLDLGDVIQIRGDGGVHHTMIVTGKSGADLLLSYHTVNRLDKSLQEIQDGLDGESLIFWKIV